MLSAWVILILPTKNSQSELMVLSFYFAYLVMVIMCLLSVDLSLRIQRSYCGCSLPDFTQTKGLHTSLLGTKVKFSKLFSIFRLTLYWNEHVFIVLNWCSLLNVNDVRNKLYLADDAFCFYYQKPFSLKITVKLLLSFLFSYKMLSQKFSLKTYSEFLLCSPKSFYLQNYGAINFFSFLFVVRCSYRNEGKCCT